MRSRIEHGEDTAACGEGCSAGSLLERLMETRCLPARELRGVHDPSELPFRLQQIACLIGSDGAWRAYTDDSQWWFAVSNAERDAGGWTLKAAFFSGEGVLCGAGSWRFHAGTGFMLTGIFEIHANADRTTVPLGHALCH